jgi:hypothetical protein
MAGRTYMCYPTTQLMDRNVEWFVQTASVRSRSRPEVRPRFRLSVQAALVKPSGLDVVGVVGLARTIGCE